MPRRCGHHVVVYHSIVEDAWNDPYEMTVSAARLEEQLGVLARRGRVVPLQAAGPGTVSVTFDDGFADNVTTALPILTAAAVHATLFITVEAIERGTFTHLDPPPPGRAWSRPARWTELEQWLTAGLSIGLHGWRHQAFTALDAHELRDDLERGKRVLENRLGISVDALAYPFGDYQHVSPVVAHIAAEAGFTRGYTAIAGANAGDTSPLMLRRIRMTELDTGEFAERKADGRFDFYGTYQRLRYRLTSARWWS